MFLKAVGRALPGVFLDEPGTTEAEANPVWGVFCFVADHVVPLAAGGANQITNLVTACWPCNFAKWSYKLDELGLDDPFRYEAVHDDWDGLQGRPALP